MENSPHYSAGVQRASLLIVDYLLRSIRMWLLKQWCLHTNDEW